MTRVLAVVLCALTFTPVGSADETTKLATGRGAVWTCSSAGVIELDTPTRKVLRHVHVGSDYPLQVGIVGETRVPTTTASVAVGAGGLWLGTAERIARVLRVDPRTLALRTFAELL